MSLSIARTASPAGSNLIPAICLFQCVRILVACTTFLHFSLLVVEEVGVQKNQM